MEITNLKENIISPSPQEPIPSSARRPGQPSEQTKKTGVNAEILKGISSGDAKAVQELTDNVNETMKSMQFNLQFCVDREAGRVVIKVVDSDGNLIRRIPPEIMETFSSEMGATIGLLLNTNL